MSMHDIRTLLLSDKPKVRLSVAWNNIGDVTSGAEQDKPTNRLPAGSVSLGPAKPAAPSPSGSAGVVSVSRCSVRARLCVDTLVGCVRVQPIPRALSRQQTFTRMAVSPPQPPASAEISPVAVPRSVFRSRSVPSVIAWRVDDPCFAQNVMYQVWTDMLSHSSNRIASVATIASTAGISVPDISLLDAAGDVSVESSRWLQAAAETYSRRTNHA
jgi:hypothetical protein